MKKLLKKLHIDNKRKLDYFISVILILIIFLLLSVTDTGSIYCDKEKNICSVKSEYENKEQYFLYNDVTSAICEYSPSGRHTSYKLFLNTAEYKYETVYFKKTKISKQFPVYRHNKYLVSSFICEFECNLAASRFMKFQNSTKNEFSEHERNYIYFVFLVLYGIVINFAWRKDLQREEKLDRILSNEKELRRLKIYQELNETKKNKNTDDKSL